MNFLIYLLVVAHIRKEVNHCACESLVQKLMRNHMLPTTFLKTKSAVHFGLLQMMLRMQNISQTSITAWVCLLNEQNKVDGAEVKRFMFKNSYSKTHV